MLCFIEFCLILALNRGCCSTKIQFSKTTEALYTGHEIWSQTDFGLNCDSAVYLLGGLEQAV